MYSMSGNGTNAVRSPGRWVRRCTAWLTGLFMLAVLAAAVPAQPAQAQALPGSFAPAECPVGVQAEGYQVDCGVLTAAESRSPFNGKTIALAVAIIRSPNSAKAPDPVLFLTGGPGQAALPLTPLLAQVYAPIIANRDMVLIDQRGTGFSRPKLDCDLSTLTEMDGGWFALGATQDSPRPPEIQFAVDALAACGQAYQAAGIDLSAYNSAENAADLEDLRVALGYPTWNLFGGSYGTRLALTAMRYRPETIRSAVLDSVYPLQGNFETTVFSSYNQSLTRLFTACAADPACNTAYPNLAATFDQMVAQLNATPALIPIFDPQTNEVSTYVPVSGDGMTQIIFNFFYATPIIPALPLLITATANGDYSLLTQIFNSPAGDTEGLNVAMTLSVQCNEDVTFNTPRDFVAARDSNLRASPLAFGILFNEAVLDVCSAWGLGNPDPAENRAVQSNVPSFLIGGEFDPITPPQNAFEQASTLPNAHVAIYPRGGHTPSAVSPCLSTAIAGFLDDPNAAPDTSCLATEAPFPFVTP